MSLTVKNWEAGNHRGTVTLSGDTFSEVAGVTAKNMAIQEATKYLGLCGISGASGPYPVDEEGLQVNDPAALKELIDSKIPFKYHNDFYISQSLGL